MALRVGRMVEHRAAVAAGMVLAVFLAFGISAVAQRPGGGDQSSGGTPYGGPPGGMGVNNSPPPGGAPGSNGAMNSTMRGGLQLGPPGRWWDDPGFAKSIGLDKDQQQRMDDVFKGNKGALVQSFKNLQREESSLDKVLRAKVLDEGQIDQQIDKVVRARGELEKANAHMLLKIRGEMTVEQTARLDEHRAPPPGAN